jgi:hypothetical protein
VGHQPRNEERSSSGVGIGKVRLGMSLTQARRALGKANRVVRRKSCFGSAYVEYSWRRADWNVGCSGGAAHWVAARHSARAPLRPGRFPGRSDMSWISCFLLWLRGVDWRSPARATNGASTWRTDRTSGRVVDWTEGRLAEARNRR